MEFRRPVGKMCIRDRSLAVLPEQVHIDARFHIKALGKAERHHMDEVAVAGHILAPQNQMAVPFAITIAALNTRLRRQLYLAANHRMDALGLAGAVKINHAVHHAVISQRA